MIAVLPAAGRGKRMQAITGGAPKELLEVCGKPTLAWALEEAFAAGADSAVVVNSPDKPLVSDLALGYGPRVSVAIQPEAIGLANAVACAAVLGPALLVSPDTVYWPFSPCSLLISALERCDAAIAAETVSDAEVSLYGILDVRGLSVRRVLEKPRAEETASRLAIAGRFAFSARFMSLLAERFLVGSAVEGAELDLTSALNAAISCGLEVRAVGLEAGMKRYDCGSAEGLALARAEIRA